MPFNINDILSKLRKKKDGKKSSVASQQTVEKAEKEREKRPAVISLRSATPTTSNSDRLVLTH